MEARDFCEVYEEGFVGALLRVAEECEKKYDFQTEITKRREKQKEKII